MRRSTLGHDWLVLCAGWALCAGLGSACHGREETLLREANRAAAKGDLASAERALSEAADGGSAATVAQWGEVLWALGRPDAAAQAWRAVPQEPSARLGLAQAALEQGDAGLALELDAAGLLKVRALLLKGDAEQALSLARALGPGAQRDYLVGCAQLAGHHYADAQATFDALSEHDRFLGSYGLARLAAVQRRPTDTLLHLTAARSAARDRWEPAQVAADPAFAFLSESGEFHALTLGSSHAP